MPRNQENNQPNDNSIEEFRWIELNSASSLIALIHRFQREQERFPKGFSQDQITTISYRGQEIELEDGEGDLNLKVSYRRPETAAERIYREAVEQERVVAAERQRRAEYFRMREEFDGIPIPEEERIVEAAPPARGPQGGRLNFVDRWAVMLEPPRQDDPELPEDEI